MAKQYAGRVAFYVVYIQEAHSTDGWQVDPNVAEGILYQQPTSTAEREAVAEACVLHMQLSIPALIDDMANTVDLAYAALPDRLYLIDAGGRVAFKSGQGPWGFKPDDLEAAIERLLAPV